MLHNSFPVFSFAFIPALPWIVTSFSISVRMFLPEVVSSATRSCRNISYQIQIMTVLLQLFVPFPDDKLIRWQHASDAFSTAVLLGSASIQMLPGQSQISWEAIHLLHHQKGSHHSAGSVAPPRSASRIPVQTIQPLDNERNTRLVCHNARCSGFLQNLKCQLRHAGRGH